MLRREFVRFIVSVMAAPKFLIAQESTKPVPPPPAPVPWTLGLNPKTPLPHTTVADGITTTDQRFFTAVQMATLVRLCDVLLPRIGDKPGATEAETPLFLDFLIGASPASRQTVYTGGLNWLDAESRKQHGKPFATASNAEADSLIRPWLRTWMSDHPPTELHANFVNIAHDDIREATENSKKWSESNTGDAEQQASSKELYWYPIQPDMHGAGAECTRIPPHVQAAPKASHTMPSYPR